MKKILALAAALALPMAVAAQDTAKAAANKPAVSAEKKAEKKAAKAEKKAAKKAAKAEKKAEGAK